MYQISIPYHMSVTRFRILMAIKDRYFFLLAPGRLTAVWGGGTVLWPSRHHD